MTLNFRIRMRFSIILFLSLAGCSGDRLSAPPIAEDKFIHIYADKIVLEEEAKLENSGGVVNLDTLYTRYQVTAPQFQTTLDYYRKDIGRWRQLHENVMNRLQELKGATMAGKN